MPDRPRPRSSLDALYSDSPFVLFTANTLIAGDRVFTGSQSDDFAVTGLLLDHSRPIRACLLGLAYGADIRTLAAFVPDIHITAVDLDELAGQTCVSLYEQYFPNLHFDFVHADAHTFLESPDNEPFDLICVDIYTPQGYPEVLFDPAFWKAVQRSLTPTGFAAVNAGGLPTYLNPLTPPSPQLTLLNLLADHWPNPEYLISKRNWTILLGAERPSDETLADRALRTAQFTGTDQAVMRLLPFRLRTAHTYPNRLPATENRPTYTRARIDQELDNRWPAFAAQLHTAAAKLGISEHDSRPENIITNGIAAPRLLNALLAGNSPLADYLVNATASMAITRNPDAVWLGHWLLNNVENLAESQPNWLLRTALPQTLALAACPIAPTWPWTNALLRLVAEYTEAPPFQ